MNVIHTSALLLALAAATAAGQASLRVALQPVQDRKPAPDFVLQDAEGKSASLTEYRDKVVLLDFWATWCTGCKQEIPWFSEFQRKYGKKGLAVIGVSLDDKGWDVVKPFLATTKIPYRIVVGDNATAHRFGIDSMPDTFLIDRQGRVAAAYKAGLVDRDNIEANIKSLLAR